MSDDGNDRARDMLVPFNARNYRLGIVNGMLAVAGGRLADINIIVPLLIHRLSGAAWMVGLVLGLRDIVRTVVEVAAARSLDTKELKKPAYISSSILRAVMYITIVAVMWHANVVPDAVVLAVVVVALLGYAAGLGLSTLASNDILAKSVPTFRRGSLQMWRRLGALVIIFAGVTPFVHWMIGPNGPFDFPRNFSVLFAVSLTASGAAWVLFAQVREPRSRAGERKLTWNQHLRRGVGLFRSDACYRRVIRIRLLIGIAAAIRPFLIVFATDVWNLSDDVAATFLAIQVGAEFIGALVVGQVSDRLGNRRAILLVIASTIFCCTAAVVAGASDWDVPLTLFAWQMNLQIIILGTAFIGSGLFLASLTIGYTNYLMDIAPEDKRPSYMGFSTAFTLPLATAPLLYGWGADTLGYQPVFVTSLVVALGALYLFLQLPEPRDELDECDLEYFSHPPGGDAPRDNR
ncbi:MAG: MFS transporter [Armatimonadota bacterium]